METKTKTRTNGVLTVMHILAWVIFVGLCIKTGAILYSFFVSLFINPVAAKDLHLGLDLSELKEFSIEHYSVMVSFVVVLWALKAYMFYQVIKIFLYVNLAKPFSSNVALLISRISYVALTIGILAVGMNGYSKWLVKKGVVLHTLPEYISGGAEFLFFAGIVFIISLVFKKGIEIQSENELTV